VHRDGDFAVGHPVVDRDLAALGLGHVCLDRGVAPVEAFWSDLDAAFVQLDFDAAICDLRRVEDDFPLSH
jgi:hypothetical protein